METRAEIPPQLRAPTGAGKLSHTTLRQDPGAPHQESIVSGVVVCSRESGKPGSARLLVDDCTTTGLSGARKCHRHFLIPRCVICYAFTCNAHPGCSELTSLWGHRSGVAGHETDRVVAVENVGAMSRRGSPCLLQPVAAKWEYEPVWPVSSL